MRRELWCADWIRTADGARGLGQSVNLLADGDGGKNSNDDVDRAKNTTMLRSER